MKKIEILGTKETLYSHQLDNGLWIYMVPNYTMKNFYATLNVKYGSIYTNYKYKGEKYSDPKGIAHYMEHLKFYTDKGDAMDYFANLGSSANAYTSHQITSFEVMSTNKFKENLEYLIDFVYNPYFTKELINSERGVICEEINMYDDDPFTSLTEGLLKNIMINDEHRYLVAGTVDDVKKIKLENIENVYDAFYKPNNMFIVITGNFNPEEAVAIISEKFSNRVFDEDIPEIKNAFEPFKINEEYVVTEKNVNKAKAAVGIKIPKSNFKSLKLSALELKMYLNLITRINFGSTSILNEEMRSNGIISSGISMNLIDTGDYYIECFFGQTNYPDYFVKRIKETLNNMVVSEEEVTRKIKSSISSLVYLFDDIDALNFEISNDVINYGTVITDSYSIYKKLNFETAKKVLNKFDNYLMSVNIIKPLENND